MKTAQWIVWHAEQQHEPQAAEAIRALVESGQLPRTALARRADDDRLDWKPLEKIPGLTPPIPVVPPPPIVPPKPCPPGNPYFTMAIVLLILGCVVGFLAVGLSSGTGMAFATGCFSGTGLCVLLGEIRAVRIQLWLLNSK